MKISNIIAPSDMTSHSRLVVYKCVEDPNTLFLYPEKGGSNFGTFLGNYVTKTGNFTLTTKRTSNFILNNLYSTTMFHTCWKFLTFEIKCPTFSVPLLFYYISG